MSASPASPKNPNDFIRQIVDLAAWPPETAMEFIDRGYRPGAVLELFNNVAQGKPQ